MDVGASECTKIVLHRIQQIGPEEDAFKIIYYLLMRHSNQQIMQYATGSDKQIVSLIDEAKSALRCSHQPFASPPLFESLESTRKPQLLPTEQQLLYTSLSSQQFPISPSSPVGALHNSAAEAVGFEDHLRLLNISDKLRNYFSPNLGGDPLGCTKLPTRSCRYFSKGFCKNGAKCHFSHGSNIPAVGSEGQTYVFGSLWKLEMEIRQLLISRGGMPVSISLLPLLYLQKYGKVLQADGYLPESQQHGKTGCRLKKLLSQFKTIAVIERRHEQHVVVLVEDAQAASCDKMEAFGRSNQIYLTFSADSTFTEEHIHNYFEQYGPVLDVRIPHQEKRMFGFVAFLYPETVKLILDKRNPHFICGTLVLVKPYKEKPKPNERKNAEKYVNFNCYAPRVSDITQDLDAMLRLSSHSELLQRKIQEREQEIELVKKRLLELEVASTQQTYEPFSNWLDAQSLPEDDHWSKLSVAKKSDNDSTDEDSGEVNLPENPFSGVF